MSTETKELLATLSGSHERLAVFVAGATDDDLVKTAGAGEWTVAEVLSHLGSQAEIFSAVLDAGLVGADPPSRESFPPIWEEWNARSPRAKAAESVSTNGALVERMEGLEPAELDTFRVALFGRDLDAAGFIRMRISEHAVHAWDVLAAFDDDTVVAPDAVLALLPGLGDLVARVGKATERDAVLAVRVTDPDSEQTLEIGQQVRLTPGGPPSPDGSLELSAEQLLRLAYGRLDPAEEGVRLVGVTADQLRSTFQGF